MRSRPTRGFHRVLWGLAVLCLPFVVVASEAPSILPLRASPVAPDSTWDGPQYVGADGKGRIFLLRVKDGLKVYPLEKGGELGEPRRLSASPVARPGPVLEAAMDRHGDWVLMHGYEPRLYRAGKEKPLPALHWMTNSVALVDGEVFAVVYPLPMGRVSRRGREHPPLLLAAGSDGWSSVVESGLEEPPDPRRYVQTRQQHASKLLADSRDTLWLANLYRYHLAHYSRAGRELMTLEVDGAKIRHREEETMEAERTSLEKERARYSRPETASISTNTAEEAILDLAEGRDGRIYLLTKGGEEGGLTLDRFDPLLGTLDRAPVAFTTPGMVSLAAGRDGLYVVPFNGRETRYLVTWEEIEAGDWRPVEGVKINGFEAEMMGSRGERH